MNENRGVSLPLSSLRDQFEGQLAAIDDEYDRNLELWPQQYIVELKNVIADYRAQGDYAGTIAAQNELQRFDISQTIREKDSAGLPVTLVNLQSQFLDLYRGYRETHARGVVDLAERHIAALKQRQAEFVKSDDMESAGQIESEIRLIRARQEFIDANAVLSPAPSESLDSDSSGL